MSGSTLSAPPPDLAAALHDVGHTYAGKKGAVQALRGIDLAIRASELTALLGINGSGKSTLLRLLAAVLRPTAGQVEVLGGGLTSRELRSRITYVGQDAALDPEMYVRETLTLMATLYGVLGERRDARLGELAAAFGLGELLARRVDELSGGQRRRLHLAAGLVHEPDLVLLDEPAAGLDAPATETLWRELRRRTRSDRRRAVVLVTHELAAAERYADRVVMLEAGRVVGDGAPAGLIAEHGAPHLGEVFRRLTGHDPGELMPAGTTGRGRQAGGGGGDRRGGP